MVDASGAAANPLYQSAHSNAAGSTGDIMNTASSMGGEYGATEAPAAAAAPPRASGQPIANPLAGGAADDDEDAGANPLFQQQGGGGATSLGAKPAGYRR